jgi:hypothetical protein
MIQWYMQTQIQTGLVYSNVGNIRLDDSLNVKPYSGERVGPWGEERGRGDCGVIFFNKTLIYKNIRPTGLLGCHAAV